MSYSITVQEDFVHAELVGSETVEETKEFLRAVARYSTTHRAFLLRIAASKPMFRVEQAGLIECFREVARTPQHKIALLADTTDLRVSHEYLEIIARQHALNARSFRTADEALRWLRQPPAAPEPGPGDHEDSQREPHHRRRDVQWHRPRHRGRGEKIG